MINSEFGNYSTTKFSYMESNSINFTRNFSIKRFNYSSDKYEILKKYYSQIIQEDKATAVLVK